MFRKGEEVTGEKGKQNAQVRAEEREKNKENKIGEHRGRKKGGKTPLTSPGGHRRRKISKMVVKFKYTVIFFWPSFIRSSQEHPERKEKKKKAADRKAGVRISAAASGRYLWWGGCGGGAADRRR